MRKHYAGRKIFGFFPMFSARFRRKAQEVGRNSPENPKIFRPEYCFHVPTISGAFLQDTMTFPHLSCRIRWPESLTWVFKISTINQQQLHIVHLFMIQVTKMLPVLMLSFYFFYFRFNQRNRIRNTSTSTIFW